MTSYVLGFLFDTNKKFVLLITKARGTLSGTDRTQVDRISDLEMNEAIIPNLRWMIPMALSFDRGEHAQHFDIQEG